VIGTLATLASDRYGELLRAQREDLIIEGKACPLFVPLAEEGWVDGEVTSAVAETYLAQMRDAGVDTVILGCTHYPILKQAIGKVMGADVHLVDSALVLAEAVAEDLKRRDAESDASEPTLDLLVSDVPQRFAELSERFLAHPVGDVELVDLEELMPAATKILAR
jgi:glutamate racemase